MPSSFCASSFPEDPIDQLRLQLAGAAAAESGGGVGGARTQLTIPDEQLQQLKEFYGFDKPIPVAYATWLWQTLQLDLGQSFRYNEPVIEVIADRLPVSIYYGLVTAFFTYAICIPLGIVKAIRHRTAVDNLTLDPDFHRLRGSGICVGRGARATCSRCSSRSFPLGGFQSAGAADMPAMARVRATSSGIRCCRSLPISWARSPSRPC